MNIIAAEHGMRDTIEIVDGIPAFEPYLNDTVPHAALQETGHRALREFAAISGSLFDEFAQRMPDDLRKGGPNKVGEAAIGGANLAVKRDRKEDVIEGIDQVAIALLGSRDDVEKLIELLLVGRNGVALFDATNQAAQLRNFLSTLPSIKPEENNENYQADREGLEAVGERTDAVPRNQCKDNGENEQQEKGESPQIALTPLELLETIGNRGASAR